MNILYFNNITYQYDESVIIKDFSLQLPKEKVIALVGPSGCGKTTILHLAAQMLRPTQGEIMIKTEQISYVFQEPRLLPWRTVQDNILFSCNDGISQESLQSMIDVMALKDSLGLYPRQLSGGMKQRTAILRAFANCPQLLFLDEPFSALDYIMKKKIIQQLIQLIEKTQVSVLYVTHDYVEAATLADEIIYLKNIKQGIYQVIKIAKKRQQRTFQDIKDIEQQLLQMQEV